VPPQPGRRAAQPCLPTVRRARHNCAERPPPVGRGSARSRQPAAGLLAHHAARTTDLIPARSEELPSRGSCSLAAAPVLAAAPGMPRWHLDEDHGEPVRVARGHLEQAPGLEFRLRLHCDAPLGEARAGRAGRAPAAPARSPQRAAGHYHPRPRAGRHRRGRRPRRATRPSPTRGRSPGRPSARRSAASGRGRSDAGGCGSRVAPYRPSIGRPAHVHALGDNRS
jgi:hypothetical protein